MKHHRRNDQRHVWLLSGTGEGPPLAKALISQGWKVTVSVVTPNAALSYSKLHLEEIIIGPISGVQGIKAFLRKAREIHSGFCWVLDATHPFAFVISEDLKRACSEAGQSLIRFERPIENPYGAILLNSVVQLSSKRLNGRNFLLAIGSRHLREAVDVISYAGANVFARVIPTQESIREALFSGIDQEHLAISRPFHGQVSGDLEAALCRRWAITDVICRQSGGITQKLWQDICQKDNLYLWMIARSSSSSSSSFETFNSLDRLLNRVLNSL